ncbi:MAG: M14 family zinc carboxypeptidase [Candidatus Kapaibacterium sp.]
MRYPLILLLLLIPAAGRAQKGETAVDTTRHVFYLDEEGWEPSGKHLRGLLSVLGPHWGFGYDSLLNRIAGWRKSPYVTIDSLGASVQNRGIWQLTITSPLPQIKYRRTVFIHARTHPGEVQAFHVADAIISFLTSEDDFARVLRDRTVFYIVPMYNPDGVELDAPRENAHGVDLERGWDKVPMEPEVATLKRRFTELMASPAPIEIALNMHSAYLCKRYFVYHEATGTSPDYAAREQRFITGVHSYFSDGIEPWPFNRTWDSVAPTHFPESWWWFNHGADVMALTYEDMNCETAGMYDSTGYAILRGIGDYLRLPASVVDQGELGAQGILLHQNYPNPFSGSTTIRYAVARPTHVLLRVFNQLGEDAGTVVDEYQGRGEYEARWNGAEYPSGVYIYRIETGDGVESRWLTLRK